MQRLQHGGEQTSSTLELITGTVDASKIAVSALSEVLQTTTSTANVGLEATVGVLEEVQSLLSRLG